MQPNHFFKASLLALVLILSFVVCWEYYWRSRGFSTTYNDDKVLWATKRKQVYQPTDQATVFIGGSRIKFDLDIPTWERLTGEKAIQLAMVGTPARLILRDLARDENFKGKLVIDVAEAQLFSLDTVRRDKSAREALEYYYQETPAQKTSAFINKVLESKLVFLEEGKFGLNGLLNDVQLPNRAGVPLPPRSGFPKEFNVTSLERQSSMTPMFLADPRLQKRQIANWIRGAIVPLNKTPGIKGDTLEAFFKQIKTFTDKIRSRGGSVVFVRPPSNGDYLETENRVFPRQAYWDRLLAYTNVSGIHYADYPQTAHFVCPEWSHLAPKDGVKYTTQLVRILQEEKGWRFPKKSTPTVYHVTP